ncbi:MAG: peptidylprolyl isomerase [Bryobacteraceae bacterium]|nr:peptidylprolyl isomerase [Bryobacteraceae bacterium]
MLLPVVFLIAFSFLSSVALAAQKVPPDTVVAVVNGRKMTAAELDKILSGAPRQLGDTLRHNPKMFVENYALVSMLREMAEKEDLASRSPYREQLEWARMQVMMQAAIAERGQGGQDKAGLEKWLEENRKAISVKLENEQLLSAATTGDETQVVTVVDGDQLTGAGLKRLLAGAPPNVRANFRNSPQKFLEQYALMARLVKDAESQKLGQKSPYREQLEWVESELLMQAKLNSYSDSINIGPKEEKEYYESHRDHYTEAKVKVLYISFAEDPSQFNAPEGRKILNEKQARDKIEGLRKQIQEGADFVKLVKEHSEDATSAAKDGDLGVVRRSDKLPEHIQKAIFALKPGEISEPVKQPNGFYLFKLDQIGTKTVEEVRQDLLRDAKNAKFQEWFDSIRKSATVTFEHEAYFAPAPAK